MDIRGYDKVERINAYVLYYNDSYVNEDEEVYPGFLVKSGFEEMTLDQAIKDELFTSEELVEVLLLVEEELE
jgi:poly-beta-hydroxyalkanoate depolymerase